jgi:preprotein translocase subunit SecD
MDSLLISEGLKGRVETQISISGSGEGETQEDAYNDAKEEMKRLQTILMTGSLPYKLEIVKLDTISPTLGKEFMGSILLAGLVAILVVALVIFFRYKSWKSSLALIATTVSEVVLILGIAAFIKWNLDLPGIAGILATIGTGIDDLVILLDESTSSKIISLKERIKRAFSIILGAYFTTFVSMLPLIWAGAGLLKGFAITTIIGISVGVLITRPAFSDFVKLRRD